MSCWQPMTPIDRGKRKAMRVSAELATAPSVAKGAAHVFPRVRGSLQFADRASRLRWLIVLGRAAARFRARLAVLASLVCLGLSWAGAASADDLVRSGTLTIEQVQIAFIGSGNLGGGTVTVGGQQYSFSIGGLGIGGFGVSKMEATGTVYNLKNINDFAGGYVQARYGMAVGTLSTGQLWLQNTKGVVLELKAKRTGLALSLGGDAVYINFD